ncbi:MAG: cell division topological specificity factor MinE [Jaaginema sp. PMC 1079.18]|nr:cell division topological specificity factor MinE [Jaaginema sp. PMC 1080.18]MEC4852006.1 cell division topological specificity factor MinE [Jaaginema sp. PMC 1079.18]MEC4866813.1 cell division topological specificity factor MinE [Jaaginema sp. PMC 1078.18]
MISELLEQLFRWKRPVNSRDEARNRLKLVIAQDRSGISSEALEAMRQEILEVVARYVEIEPSESEFSLESDDRMTALIANLPIKRVRSQPEPDSPISSETDRADNDSEE